MASSQLLWMLKAFLSLGLAIGLALWVGIKVPNPWGLFLAINIITLFPGFGAILFRSNWDWAPLELRADLYQLTLHYVAASLSSFFLLNLLFYFLARWAKLDVTFVILPSFWIWTRINLFLRAKMDPNPERTRRYTVKLKEWQQNSMAQTPAWVPQIGKWILPASLIFTVSLILLTMGVLLGGPYLAGRLHFLPYETVIEYGLWLAGGTLLLWFDFWVGSKIWSWWTFRLTLPQAFCLVALGEMLLFVAISGLPYLLMVSLRYLPDTASWRLLGVGFLFLFLGLCAYFLFVVLKFAWRWISRV